MDERKLAKTVMIVGTLGSGKSSVGRWIASYFGVPFVDSDKEVEKAADCSVRDFFEMYGEEAFRDCERRVLNRLLNDNVCVLSSGGGAFLNDITRKLAKEKALTVWLKADSEVLFQRLKGRKRRPQIPNNLDELQLIINGLIEREYPIYSEADIIEETFEEPAATTAMRVVKRIEKAMS